MEDEYNKDVHCLTLNIHNLCKGSCNVFYWLQKLDPSQLKLILDSKVSESPFWLYLVCEELRVYGDFRTLTNRVKAITTSLDGTIEAILQRLISEDDTGFMEKV